LPSEHPAQLASRRNLIIMKRRNSRRESHRHYSHTAPVLVEPLEGRTLLAAVIPAIQIENQAPVVLPDVNGRELVALADADSTRLFTTDGTQAGTVQFADIPTVLGGDVSGYAIIGTNLFFATAGPNGPELWKTDGTAAGTAFVKDGINQSFDDFAVLGDQLLFPASGDRLQGMELFKTDGTATGTEIVVDLYPGLDSTSFYVPPGDGTFEIWINEVDADGALISPRVVHKKDVPQVGHTHRESLPAGYYRHWTRQTDSNGVLQNWSAQRTQQVYDQAYSSQPSDLTVFNGEVYFAAEGIDSGRELWKTDGTEAGTTLVADINPGEGTLRPHGSDPHQFMEFDGNLFFMADTTGESYYVDLELWRTDGTASGTVAAGAGGLDAAVAVVNNRLVALETDNAGRLQLVALTAANDATPEVVFDRPQNIAFETANYGTVQSPTFLDSFVVVDDKLSFVAFDYDSHAEFTYSPSDWRHAVGGYLNRYDTTSVATRYITDATAGGTQQLPSDDLELVFAERRYPSDAPHTDTQIVNSATISGAVVASDHGVWRIDDSMATRVTTQSQFATLGPDVFALIDSERLVQVDATGTKTELAVPLNNATNISEIGGAIYITANSGSGTALLKLDPSSDTVSGPQILTPTVNAPATFGEVTTSWAAVTDAASYDVEVHFVDVSGQIGSLAASQERTTETSFAADLLDHSYRVRVRAHLGTGKVSTWSERYFSVAPPVAGPTILTPSDNAIVPQSSVQLSWSSAVNAASYDLRIDPINDDSLPTIEQLDTNSYTAELTPGNHRVDVRTRFADGSLSDWTTRRIAITTPIPTIVARKSVGEPLNMSFIIPRVASPDSLTYMFEVYDNATGDLVTYVGNSFNQSTRTPWLEQQIQMPGSGQYRVSVHYQFGASSDNPSTGTIRSAAREVIVDVEMPFGQLQPQYMSGTNTGTQLHLSWQHIVPADHYEVRYHSQPPGETSSVLHHFTNVADNVHRLPLPTGAENVWAEVRGVKADGTFTEWSYPEGFRLAAEAVRYPVRPAGLFGLTSDSTPTIEWRLSGQVSLSPVRYEMLIQGDTAVYRHSNITSTSHEVETQLPNGSYDVFVRAHYDGSTTSNWSYPLGRITIAADSAAPPEILAPEPIVSETRPTFEWSDNPAAARYELWVSTDSVVDPVIHETHLTQDSFTPSADLAPGAYRMWVRTHFDDGTKTRWTATHRFEVRDSVVQATGGVGLQSTGTPTISWEYPPDVARYDLYINRIGISQPAYRRTHLTTNVHTLETQLEPGDYEVWVQAYFNDGSKTRWGKSGIPLTIGNPPPANFSTVVPTLSVQNNVASWPAIDGAVTYNLWINEGSEYDLLHGGLVVGHSREINLPAGTYRGWLKAVSADGIETRWSSVVDFVIS